MSAGPSGLLADAPTRERRPDAPSLDEETLRWLKETDPGALEELWRMADETRRANVGRRGASARAHRDLQPLRAPVRLLRRCGPAIASWSATA